jgi:hypothetical protein
MKQKYFGQNQKKYQKAAPDDAQSIFKSLIFFGFPEEECISTSITKIIEHLNKELNLRAKSILAFLK